MRINTTFVWYAAEWRVRPQADALDFSNFEGQGYRNWISGLLQLTATVSGWQDVGLNTYEGDHDLIAGAILANMRLYYQSATGPHWSLTSVFVEDVEETARVEDLIRYTTNVKAKGTWVYPTGNL